ncbi:hypothetical protein PI124_g18920 [Phytophthora idaei]|nr:hypothetical protein PI125_g21293 [Phytophthora idaei]KAG3135398.1 hypothetical protein PI126_g18276 [Phytophthora idaei]KAG3236071.1 hypothetical protein PI124_g18920 [Phytophthora idaei]
MENKTESPGLDDVLVELSRRRRRNKAGHYSLEDELRPRRDENTEAVLAMVRIEEYDQLLHEGRVVEGFGWEEGVQQVGADHDELQPRRQIGTSAGCRR